MITHESEIMCINCLKRAICAGKLRHERRGDYAKRILLTNCEEFIRQIGFEDIHYTMDDFTLSLNIVYNFFNKKENDE